MKGIVLALALMTMALAAAAASGETAIPRFAEETAPSGLAHSFTGEWTFMVGGGAAVFDCNGDLRPEVLLAGGTAPAQLFRNDSAPGGALAFAALPDSGLAIDQVSGAWPLDIDGDGITDLALLRVGPDRLMRGLGDCRFEEASADWGFDGLDLWSTAFAATWEKGQSWPTLAVGSYIDRRQEAFPWGSCTPNHLYRPAPGGGYGAALPLSPGFCALSILFTDWNRSGRPSLRVSNDREYYKGGQEQLWHFPADGPPRLYTPEEGWAKLRIWGMGIAQSDVTGDGYPDYFLTSMADNKLQVLKDPASGKPQYADQAFKRGVTAHRPFTGGDPRPSTAWHAEFTDVNLDGRVDLYVVKGNVWQMPDFAEKDPNNLLIQNEDGSFTEAAETAGVLSFAEGRGGAAVDLNADGLPDLIAVNRNAPTQVWRNLGGPGMGHFLALRLSQPQGNRDAVGAIVEIRAPGLPVQTREITVGGGHGGGHLAPLHVGLGTAETAEIRITWPGTAGPGPWQSLAADRVWLLAEQAKPVPIAP
ncbi:CRTAC1 family protein [Xinfangfangia pollutisoli]|uniref:CRTAC1 family protein n=1 Tax=Xinfangfangia pollutisoli TaxID=2865960 RepID=UPI001CD1F8BD|nr:CRTAC1 family protein [Xinfangfangia pollutisoli]